MIIDDCEKIENAYTESFDTYLFSFNQDKSNILTSPFITATSSIKTQSINFLRNFLNSYHGPDNNRADNDKVDKKEDINEKNFCTKSHTKAKLFFINSYKNIIFQNNADIIGPISLLLTLIYKEIRHIYSISQNWKIDTDRDRQKKLFYYISDIIYIVFYFLSFLQKHTICLSTNKILLHIIDLSDRLLHDTYKFDVYLAIYNNISKFIEYNIDNNKIPFISWSDLLLILIKLDKKGFESKLPSNFIEKIINNNITNNGNELKYFEICAVLFYIKFYIKKDYKYENFFKKIIEHIKEYYKEHKNMNRSEVFMLYFDFIACPEIENTDKNYIIKCVTRVEEEQKINEIRNEIMENNTEQKDKNYWFIDWGWDVSHKDSLDILNYFNSLIDYK
jgi:hypothetical protein